MTHFHSKTLLISLVFFRSPCFYFVLIFIKHFITIIITLFVIYKVVFRLSSSLFFFFFTISCPSYLFEFFQSDDFSICYQLSLKYFWLRAFCFFFFFLFLSFFPLNFLIIFFFLLFVFIIKFVWPCQGRISLLGFLIVRCYQQSILFSANIY